MDEPSGARMIGLPEDFGLSSHEAERLGIDAVLSVEPAAVTLDHAETRIGTHLKSVSDEKAAQAFYLLYVVLQFGMSRGPRQVFNEKWSGTYDGQPARGPLPQDLTDSHVGALTRMLESIMTPVLRARVAHVLWVRERPRQRAHAAAAVSAYLAVAEATFDPESWSISAQHLTRAYEIATSLGKGSPERARVVDVALDFVERLKMNEPHLYTERIAVLIHEALPAAALETLLERVKSLAEGFHTKATSELHFHHARAYYDVGITLANRLQHFADAKSLALTRAETFIAEADVDDRSEMQRSSSLRLALRALRQAGAPRERLNEVAQLLDEAQELSVHEMARIGTPFSTEHISEPIREMLRGREPLVGLWLLASQQWLSGRANAMKVAEASMKHAPLTFGLRHTALARDGRREGETPGSFGPTDDYASALEGAMRMHASRDRIIKAYGAIEPGREQLLLNHEFTLESIYLAVRDRPFIPYGHEMLWAKGIHAGLVGEMDVALHLLVPQLEHALREVLRREREIIYGTSSSGVQSVIGLEKVLLHQKTIAIFGEDVVFTIGAALAERLGANTRNMVAHGMINDAQSAGGDAIYVWWLCLHMLFGFGTPPITNEPSAGSTTENQPPG
jgi:hypothetical protein